MFRSLRTMCFASIFVCAIALLASPLQTHAATWYVDKLATGAGNGTSWANAWTSPLSIAGVAAGDTVYISGGPSGSSFTYDMSSYWNPPSGNSSARITYQIGQDSSHNGTAIFHYSGASPNGNPWLSGPTYINVSGDAGDGLDHFALTGYTYGSTNMSHARISYIDATASGLLQFANWNVTQDMELDHSSIYITDPTASVAITGTNTASTTWDNTKIHDNVFHLPRSNTQTGYGADGISLIGGGVSIYNNTLTEVPQTFSGGQHGDGIQDVGGQFYKIYGNTITDFGNYGIYMDGYTADQFSHVWIYDNVIHLSDSTLVGSSFGIVAGVDSGYSGAQPYVFNDVAIANNTVSNFGVHSIALNNVTGITANFVSSLIENNAIVDSGSAVDTTNASAVTVSNNAFIANSAATSSFVGYTQYGGTSNDYHIKSTDTTLMDKGASLASYFTTDKDAVSRPQGGAWDIGAYEFSSTSPVVSSVAASGMTQSASTLHASISDAGGASITQSGFAYGTTSNLQIVIATSTLGAQSGAVSFSDSIASLACATRYYFRPYATNSVGTGYGTIASFSTSACNPVLTSQAASSLSTTGATLNASITATGGANATQSGFAWGTVSNLSGGDTATTTEGSQTGTVSFTHALSGLTCATTYYARSYATNSGGTGYGSILSFTTSVCRVVAAPATIPAATFSSGSSASRRAANLAEAARAAQATQSFTQSSTQNSSSVSLPTIRSFIQSLVTLGILPEEKAAAALAAVSAPISTSHAPSQNLASGYRGPSVKTLQTILSTEGYFKATPNGIFGPQTLSALRAFQKSHGVPATGYYGPLTRAAMGQD